MNINPCKHCGSEERYDNGRCRPCSKLRSKKTYWLTREHQLSRKRQYRETNKVKVKTSHNNWKRNNPNYYREVLVNDIQYVIRNRLRARFAAAVKNTTKTGSAVRDLGCSVLDLKYYLEKQFLLGMTWENRSEWEIDHIVPLSAFDLTDSEQVKKACHYSNLQPLWRRDNRSKGNKVATCL